MFLNTITYLVSSRYLKVQIEIGLLLKAATAALAMGLVLNAVGEPTGVALADIAIKILLGAILYLGAMYAIDRRVRDLATDALANLPDRGTGREP